MTDPLAAWRCNPFFGARRQHASVARRGRTRRPEVARTVGAGSASARHYDTPFGPATRDADSVRQALATLRDPNERVVHELLANIAPRRRWEAHGSSGSRVERAERALGWSGRWAE